MMERTQEVQALRGPKDIDILKSEVEFKVLGAGTEAQDGYDGDEDQLARLGKKQVLKVCCHPLRLRQSLCSSS